MKYTSKNVEKLSWLPELFAAVRQHVEQNRERQTDRGPALEQELQELDDLVVGWTQSLGKPNLSPAVRAQLESELERAVMRQDQIRQEQAAHLAAGQRADDVLDVDQVVDSLNRLDDVLARGNPAAANIELSMHINRIECHSDGRVVVQTCKLGALAGAADLLKSESVAPVQLAPAAGPVEQAPRQRRRPRLRVTDDDLPGIDADEAAWVAADNYRFAGLGPEWFWLDEFRLPEKKSWAEENAAKVAQLRQETGWSLSRLAEHFDMGRNSIHRALLFAKKQEEEKNGDQGAA
jgi:hypothetical protein